MRFSAERDGVQLHSTYFDTAHLDLTRNGISLHHRVGSTDPGWQLKIPYEAGRIEIVADTDPTNVPDQMRELTAGVRHGPLVKTAVLSIDRDLCRLVDHAQRTLATVSDDTIQVVGANPLARPERWREIAVEQGPAAAPELLAALHHRLIAAGAHRIAELSKLDRLVPAGVDGVGALAANTRRRPDEGASAAAVIASHVHAQRVALVRGDVLLRAGMIEVRDTWDATWRLRYMLHVFADVFDAGRAAQLDDILAWYAGLLGAVRDCDVLGAHLDAAIADQPAGLVPDSARQHIHAEISSQREQALARLRHAMNGARYRHLLDDVTDWATTLPCTSMADRPVATIEPTVRSAQRSLRRRLARLAEVGGDGPATPADDEVVAALRRVDKAANRTRCAIESHTPPSASVASSTSSASWHVSKMRSKIIKTRWPSRRFYARYRSPQLATASHTACYTRTSFVERGPPAGARSTWPDTNSDWACAARWALQRFAQPLPDAAVPYGGKRKGASLTVPVKPLTANPPTRQSCRVSRRKGLAV